MRDGNLGHHSPVRGFPDVHERRETYGGGIRIYFAWDGSTLIILLGGGNKSSQRRDIERAYQAWQSYQSS
jgi:putative addiction module killer protein